MATILEFFVSILLFMDSIIYSLISWVYQIILVLCQIDILGNTNAIDELINRLYIIIGVIVLFLVAYSLLKSMINPDDTLKNKKGPVAIIRDVLISIVLIALVPTIFQFAVGFQNALLTQNTLGRVILGTQGGSEASGVEDGGMFFASNVLSAFLHPTNCPQADDGSYDCSNAKVATGSIGIPFIFSITTETTNFNEMWTEITSSGSLLGITTFAFDITHDGNVTYYYIISTVVGVFVLLVLLSYCIDVAIRVVKLAVYELIAPLPILMRIVPSEQGNKVFSNWLKACISTYLEVFIRLAILFFAVFLAKIVVDNFTTIFAPLVSGEAGWTVVLFAQMFLILGIILFIKQAPGLIKEITGLDGGKYSMFGGIKQGLSAIGAMGALGTGAVRGFTTGFDKDHKIRSVFGGVKNGLTAGSRGFVSALGKDYKNVRDLRRNTSAAVNEAIDRQRRKASKKLMEKQELEEWREQHPNDRNLPNILYKATSKAHKGVHDIGTGVIDWATAGGLDALKQKRDQIAEVQKAMAQTVSMAKGEVEKNLKDYVNAQGVTLDRLQIDVDYFKAQLAGVKADEALTNRYSELQTKLLNEKDAVKQDELRHQMADIQSEIDRDVATKRSTASNQLKIAQDALDKGIKDATQMIIDYTYANKNGQMVKINGQDWQVQTVAGLSAQIAKADNLLKQNSSLMPENLPSDNEVTITNENGNEESSRSRDYKGYRNTLGSEVDKLDAEKSKYVERREKKEDK